MKVVILAGGYGTRLSEETGVQPKPMVEIGGKPILWHIMKTYSSFGFNEFIILLGYKGYCIREYFSNYFLHQSDITIDIGTGGMKIHNNFSEPWKITLLDTGLNSMTGARIKKAKNHIGDEDFLLTYGDGVADIDIDACLKFHKSHGKLMTITSAQPEGRFGALDISEDCKVVKFTEKPRGDDSWVNAGYFICKSGVFDYINDNEDEVFEADPLRNLASDGELYTYKHSGFWMPMDTLRDKMKLEEMCDEGNAKWMVWNDSNV